MKYLEIQPDDPELETFIFFEDDPTGRKKLKERYSRLVCPGRRCGKFDEYKALALGESDDVKIKIARDLVETFDSCVVASMKFREVIENHGIGGIEFVTTGSAAHFIIRPTIVVPVDTKQSGMEFKGQLCAVCGRYRQTLHSPEISSLQVPRVSGIVFSAMVRPESRDGRSTMLYTDEETALIMKSNNLKGIDWKGSFGSMIEI